MTSLRTPKYPAADAAYVPIEQVQLGQRLVGTNPLTEDVELDEPDPALARTVVLEATKPDGQLLHAELIWPVEWITEVGATVDGQIEVAFGEIETTGTARVVAIGPCPELEPGPGALVVGRYRHELVDAPMVELTLDDDSESVHVTANHPYWSVDRQDFTPAGQLRVGETVDTLSGTAHVAAARSYRYTGTVYNLETTEHVYLVGSSGTLVHNNRNCLLGAKPNRSSGQGRARVAFQSLKSNTTRLGVIRQNARAWRSLRNLWDMTGDGKILSWANRFRIATGRTPRVDDAWIKYFPGDADIMGKLIPMHHVNGGPITVPLPVPRHLEAHMPGGYRYNPGGPGRSG